MKEKIMEEPKYLHNVASNITDREIAEAILNSTEIEADCGVKWIPQLRGEETDALPVCRNCHKLTALDADWLLSELMLIRGRANSTLTKLRDIQKLIPLMVLRGYPLADISVAVMDPYKYLELLNESNS